MPADRSCNTGGAPLTTTHWPFASYCLPPAHAASFVPFNACSCRLWTTQPTCHLLPHEVLLVLSPRHHGVMAAHIRCPYRTCTRTFRQPGGLYRHLQVRHRDLVNVSQAVLAAAEHPTDSDDDKHGAAAGDGDWGGARTGGECGGGGDAATSGCVGSAPCRDGVGVARALDGAGGVGDVVFPGGTVIEDARMLSARGAGGAVVDLAVGRPDARASTESSSDTDWTYGDGQSSSDSDDSACTEPLTGSEDDEDMSTDEYAMDELPPDLEPAGDPRAAVEDLFVESLRQQTPVQLGGQMDYGGTLCGRVLQWFYDLHDAEQSEPVFAGFGDIGNFPRFDTPALQRTFSYVRTAGGAGLGRQQANDFYATVRAIESACDGQGPVGLRFPNKTIFWKAIRNEKRRTLEALGWRTVPIVIADKSYPLLYRDALNVAQELVRQVAVDKLQWDATAADDADTNDNHVWTGPFDSAAFVAVLGTTTLVRRPAEVTS